MDEGQRCEVEQSKRQDETVSKDMLRDKGASRLRGEGKFLSQRGFARSELGSARRRDESYDRAGSP